MDQPVASAFKQMWPFYDIRTLTEAEFNKRHSHIEGKWRSKGSDHAELSSGFIMRRLEDKARWTVEISNINELLELVGVDGSIIIHADRSLSGYEIEIYDELRE